MTPRTHFCPWMASAFPFLLGLTLTVLLPLSAFARADGIDKGGAGCGGCHGNAATDSLEVTLTGSTTLLPDEIAMYTLSIDPGVSAGGGFSVETSGGTLMALDANTQLSGGTINHLDAFTSAPAGNIGDWQYSFLLMAPSTIGEVVVLAATGMAFNGDFSNSTADIWNFIAPFSITVVPEPTTGLLLGMGLGILGVVGRRRTLRM